MTSAKEQKEQAALLSDLSKDTDKSKVMNRTRFISALERLGDLTPGDPQGDSMIDAALSSGVLQGINVRLLPLQTCC
jgi:hypothetical protein